MALPPTPAEIAARVASGLGMVRAVAVKLLRGMPSFMRLDDLIAVGSEGLHESAQRFDPALGVGFLTFAYYRVRGAMLDHYRRECAASPRARAKAAALHAIDDLAERRLLEQPPTAPAGSADAVNEAAAALSSILEDAAVALTLGEFSEEVTPDGPVSPEVAVQQRELRSRLNVAIAKLPKRERVMLDGVYGRGDTIEEAGKRLKLTKSWASRLHARALELLREALGEELDALLPSG